MRRTISYTWGELLGCLAFAVLLGAAFGYPGCRLGGAEPAPQMAGARAVLDEQVAAWNRGDLDGFMKGYWRSDDLRFYSGGTVTSGWQATLDRYTKRYKSEGKEMGTLTFSDVTVETLGSDSAFARGRWKVVTSKETFDGLFTLVLKRFPEG